MNKVCFKCKTEKPIADYYRHSEMKDGHLNKCKECTKRDAKQHRYGPNREKILSYDRARGNRQKPGYQRDYAKRNKDIILEKARFYRLQNQKKIADKTKRYRLDNPEKYKAHTIAKRIPIKPCEVCGTTENVHRHHDDYTKPRDVRFLCAEHHRQHHASHI